MRGDRTSGIGARGAGGPRRSGRRSRRRHVDRERGGGRRVAEHPDIDGLDGVHPPGGVRRRARRGAVDEPARRAAQERVPRREGHLTAGGWPRRRRYVHGVGHRVAVTHGGRHDAGRGGGGSRRRRCRKPDHGDDGHERRQAGEDLQTRARWRFGMLAHGTSFSGREHRSSACLTESSSALLSPLPRRPRAGRRRRAAVPRRARARSAGCWRAAAPTSAPARRARARRRG